MVRDKNVSFDLRNLKFKYKYKAKTHPIWQLSLTCNHFIYKIDACSNKIILTIDRAETETYKLLLFQKYHDIIFYSLQNLICLNYLQRECSWKRTNYSPILFQMIYARRRSRFRSLFHFIWSVLSTCDQNESSYQIISSILTPLSWCRILTNVWISHEKNFNSKLIPLFHLNIFTTY